MWTRCLVLLLLLLAVPLPFSPAQTQEPTVGNHSAVDARAVGMGGAFTAVADSSAALHWNPAGLAQLSGNNFKLELATIDRHADAQLPSSGDVTTGSRVDIRLNQLVAAFPLSSGQSQLALALGIDRAANLDTQLDILGKLGPDATVLPGLTVDERAQENGGIYIWRAGMAGFVAPRFAVGGTLDIWTGDMREQMVSEIADPDNVAEIAYQQLEDTVDRSYLGLGMSLGMMAQVHRYIQFGSHIQLPMDLEVDEYWTQSTSQRNDDGTDLAEFDDGTILYDIHLPLGISFGMSLGNHAARVATDVEYTHWTGTEYSILPEASIGFRDFEAFYRDVFQWRVGVEYLVNTLDTRVRTGYWHHPLAFTANQILRDRDFWSVGIGTFVGKELEVDFAYAYGRWEVENQLLRQSVTSHQIYVSATYHYP